MDSIYELYVLVMSSNTDVETGDIKYRKWPQ